MPIRRLGTTLAALVATLLLLAGACTVPTSSEATVIAQEDLPLLLRDDPAVTTTAADSSTQTVALYYLRTRIGEDPVLELVRKPATIANRQQALFALLANPATAEEREAGLNNLLGGIELPSDTNANGGVLQLEGTRSFDEDGLKIREIRLNGAIDLDGPQLRQAYAQLVYTATEGSNVDGVRFIIDQQVATISLGTGFKELVNRADFADLGPISE